MGTREAKAIGFIDDRFGGDVVAFEHALANKAKQVAQREDFWHLLRDKRERRVADERAKPLATYREEELKHMHANFFGPDRAYHVARLRFVYKGPPAPTPEVTERNLLRAGLN